VTDETTSRQTSASARPLCILFVEDNDNLREMMSLLMEADDREVVACASGEEALALCAGRPFDVVITDVSLPGISGTELARRLLATAPRRWVVLCSGYGYDDALVRQLGPNVRSLAKPFEVDELDTLLAEVDAAR